MADATTAARDRIDRALSLLERKVLDLRLRNETSRVGDEDDLFAMPAPPPARPDDQRRIAELEAAGRDASTALAAAALAVREILADTEDR